MSSEVSRIPFAFQTESGERFEFGVTPKRDVLPYDFEVADGAVIAKGGYDFTAEDMARRRLLGANVSSRGNPSGNLSGTRASS